MLSPKIFNRRFDHGDDGIEVAAGEPDLMGFESGWPGNEFSQDGTVFVGPEETFAAGYTLPDIILSMRRPYFAIRFDECFVQQRRFEPRPAAIEFLSSRSDSRGRDHRPLPWRGGVGW